MTIHLNITWIESSKIQDRQSAMNYNGADTQPNYFLSAYQSSPHHPLHCQSVQAHSWPVGADIRIDKHSHTVHMRFRSKLTFIYGAEYFLYYKAYILRII